MALFAQKFAGLWLIDAECMSQSRLAGEGKPKSAGGEGVFLEDVEQVFDRRLGLSEPELKKDFPYLGRGDVQVAGL